MSFFERLIFLVFIAIFGGSAVTGATDNTSATVADWFLENDAWEQKEIDGLKTALVYRGAIEAPQLRSRQEFGDNIVKMTFRLPTTEEGQAMLLLQARYPVPLNGERGEWLTLVARVRGSRYDEANNKTADAMVLDVVIAGKKIMHNEIFERQDPTSEYEWENGNGPTTLLVNMQGFTLGTFEVRRANFDAVEPPEKSGADNNFSELIDFVALGRDSFTGVGCVECHAVDANDTAIKTGPALWGLFRHDAREREIMDLEGHRFDISVDSAYLHRSVRDPQADRAVAETAAIVPIGQPFLPIMPPYIADVVTDQQIDAIGAYLKTLNPPHSQGPVEYWLTEAGQENYDPMADRFLLLVDDQVRIQRGPMADVSGRALHVGQPNGIHYSFDPRVLGIAKIWQGGFLNMAGEWRNRGGGGLKVGYESREIDLGETGVLIAPLHGSGAAIDFSFKEAIFQDVETRLELAYSDIDPLERLAREDAAFLGYQRDSSDALAVPTFSFRVGRNRIQFTLHVSGNGMVNIVVDGTLAEPQSFRLNSSVLDELKVSTGSISDGVWTLPTDAKLPAKAHGQIPVVAEPWRPTQSEFPYHGRIQPLVVEPGEAKLPAGYTVEDYLAPRDNYGRPLLFEALGVAQSPDGTIVVATRTAGIWRIMNGEWRLFAEGLFDSLGVVVEDQAGLVVVAGHKAGLSRISDTTGDGVADHYEVLTDAFSFHGNYHSYLHGPVRDPVSGDYFITLNLAHNNDGGYFNASGNYMGTAGGYRGWAARVPSTGGFEPWADGLRSPAGLAFAPDGRLWYAENQGEYVGTSKLFVLEKGHFYGHPAGLIDRADMTPDSPELAWDAVKHTRASEVILLPQNRLANSPGNMTWDTTGGEFGAFDGQMFIGDQTQSVLMRIVTDKVAGIEQGVAIPFGRNLESGIMRPVFLTDGSLLLGQTGRGWQASGGNVSSLQRLVWDGVTIAPAIFHLNVIERGFEMILTRPLPIGVSELDVNLALQLESWVYRDAPDYGSVELDRRLEGVTRVMFNESRDKVTLLLEITSQPEVHETQTARVYHFVLDGAMLWGDQEANEPGLEAYYTLHHFAPAEDLTEPNN